MKKAHWVILSAGVGSRMGMPLPKTLALLGDFEVFLYSLIRAASWQATSSICLPVSEAHFASHIEALQRLSRHSPLKVRVNETDHPELWGGELQMSGRTVKLCVCYGGQRRQDSVFRGLKTLKVLGHVTGADAVFIHDSARPFLDLNVCEQQLSFVDQGLGVVPGLPLVDTVKETKDGMVLRTIERGNLIRVQTPQVFQFDDILSVHAHPRWNTQDVTDDSQMAENLGLSIRVVEGSASMRKLTTGDDWQWAKTQLITHSFGWDKATISIH